MTYAGVPQILLSPHNSGPHPSGDVIFKSNRITDGSIKSFTVYFFWKHNFCFCSFLEAVYMSFSENGILKTV